jgi:hypothetical protein
MGFNSALKGLISQNIVSVRSGHEIDRLTGTNNTAAVTDKCD